MSRRGSEEIEEEIAVDGGNDSADNSQQAAASVPISVPQHISLSNTDQEVVAAPSLGDALEPVTQISSDILGDDELHHADIGGRILDDLAHGVDMGTGGVVLDDAVSYRILNAAVLLGGFKHSPGSGVTEMALVHYPSRNDPRDKKNFNERVERVVNAISYNSILDHVKMPEKRKTNEQGEEEIIKESTRMRITKLIAEGCKTIYEDKFENEAEIKEYEKEILEIDENYLTRSSKYNLDGQDMRDAFQDKENKKEELRAKIKALNKLQEMQTLKFYHKHAINATSKEALIEELQDAVIIAIISNVLKDIQENVKSAEEAYNHAFKSVRNFNFIEYIEREKLGVTTFLEGTTNNKDKTKKGVQDILQSIISKHVVRQGDKYHRNGKIETIYDRANISTRDLYKRDGNLIFIGGPNGESWKEYLNQTLAGLGDVFDLAIAKTSKEIRASKFDNIRPGSRGSPQGRTVRAKAGDAHKRKSQTASRRRGNEVDSSPKKKTIPAAARKGRPGTSAPTDNTSGARHRKFLAKNNSRGSSSRRRSGPGNAASRKATQRLRDRREAEERAKQEYEQRLEEQRQRDARIRPRSRITKVTVVDSNGGQSPLNTSGSSWGFVPDDREIARLRRSVMATTVPRTDGNQKSNFSQKERDRQAEEARKAQELHNQRHAQAAQQEIERQQREREAQAQRERQQRENEKQHENELRIKQLELQEAERQRQHDLAIREAIREATREAIREVRNGSMKKDKKPPKSGSNELSGSDFSDSDDKQFYLRRRRSAKHGDKRDKEIEELRIQLAELRGAQSAARNMQSSLPNQVPVSPQRSVDDDRILELQRQINNLTLLVSSQKSAGHTKIDVHGSTGFGGDSNSKGGRFGMGGGRDAWSSQIPHASAARKSPQSASPLGGGHPAGFNPFDPKYGSTLQPNRPGAVDIVDDNGVGGNPSQLTGSQIKSPFATVKTAESDKPLDSSFGTSARKSSQGVGGASNAVGNNTGNFSRKEELSDSDDDAITLTVPSNDKSSSIKNSGSVVSPSSVALEHSAKELQDNSGPSKEEIDQEKLLQEQEDSFVANVLQGLHGSSQGEIKPVQQPSNIILAQKIERLSESQAIGPSLNN